MTTINPEDAFAILVNPVTRELVSCFKSYSQRRSVLIYRPSGTKLGVAYWDEDEKYEIDENYYLRSHSPDGVTIKGHGYGFLLYGALSMRAYQDDRLAYGICSPESAVGRHYGRSSLATAFWNRMVELEIAKEIGKNVINEEERFATISVDCDVIDDDDCSNVVDDKVSVSYEAVEREYVTIQYLRTEDFLDQGVLLWKDGSIPPGVADIPQEVLAGADLSHCDVWTAEKWLEAVSELSPDWTASSFMTLPSAVRSELLRQGLYEVPMLANGRIASRSNKKLDELWSAFYGPLQELP